MERVKSESEYNMIDWWKKVFISNYANFNGRARRSEYWYFTLFNILILFAFAILLGLISSTVGIDQYSSTVFSILAILFGLYVLSLIIPTIAVAIRRLHDTGKSGWWYLLGIIPIVSYIGGIVLLVFYCMDGDRGQNEYGPDPKNPNDSEIDLIGR